MSTNEYRFRLFVVGNEPNSRLAEQNLRALCQEYLPDRHDIEIVDVLTDFEAALNAQIMVVPAVVMEAPRSVTLFGTLANKAAVMSALAL
jgi:circadian clock protein KaiB